jgi:creatinine amidohydrolase
MESGPNLRPTLDARPPDIAVLGIGAIEQHGAHLPIGTDWMVACELSKRVAVALNALLLPAIPVSMSECHGSLGGTVWLKPATLAAVVQDIAGCLRRQQILNLLIINCHGGNFILDPTIQELNLAYPGMRILIADENWPSADERPIFERAATDLHAGEIETSLMLFLAPDLVGDQRVDYVPPYGREFLDYVTMDRISPAGVWGSPSQATAEKGTRAMAAQVSAIAAFARQGFGIEP